MLASFGVAGRLRVFGVLAVVGILSLSAAVPTVFSSIESPDVYPNPGSDYPWTPQSYTGVGDIQTAYNNGRDNENSSLPDMTLPSQAAWDAMSDNEKALWLVNNERQARGLAPLHGFESNVTGVAQAYADYLLDNDKWGHNENGTTRDRLEANSKINNCHDDFVLWMENLAAFGKSSGSIPLPIERAIYDWMYDDSGSSWLHRQMILYEGFIDNPPSGKEGLMGIGRANGKPYTIKGTKYDVAEVVVMNAFDPCDIWNYVPAPAGFNKASPNNGATNQATSVTLQWNASTGASSYEYCYDTSNDNKCSGWQSNGSSTSKTISGLQKGKKYYWHVRAVNPEGWTYSNTSGTAYWNFTTGSGGSPPTAKSVYLPIMLGKASSTARVLSGRVTDKGDPVQTTVELRYYNGSSWSTYATAGTNTNGEYEFRNLPNLTGNQQYYVRKVNVQQIIYWLSAWYCSVITASTTDSNLYKCDFNLENVNLLTPNHGDTVTLPKTFSWTKRSTTSDSYLFRFSDRTDNDAFNDPYFESNPLGYVGSYTLNGLPAGFSTGKQYGWWVAVLGSNGYGESLYYYNVNIQ